MHACLDRKSGGNDDGNDDESAIDVSKLGPITGDLCDDDVADATCAFRLLIQAYLWGNGKILDLRRCSFGLSRMGERPRVACTSCLVALTELYTESPRDTRSSTCSNNFSTFGQSGPVVVLNIAWVMFMFL